MSIDKITDPASVPAAVADYQAQNTHLDRLLGNAVVPFPIDGTDIKKGSLFNIGGDMFYTSSDTAITGSASDYVKLTPGASVAVPTYVANLSGVTWNDAYNGYYDVGGNLYVFDTAKAIYDAAIAAVKDVLGVFAEAGHFKGLNVANDFKCIGGSIPAFHNVNPAGSSDVAYDAISSFFPNIGDVKSMAGTFIARASENLVYHIGYAERVAADEISVFTLRSDVNAGTMTSATVQLLDGSGDTWAWAMSIF